MINLLKNLNLTIVILLSVTNKTSCMLKKFEAVAKWTKSFMFCWLKPVRLAKKSFFLLSWSDEKIFLSCLKPIQTTLCYNKSLYKHYLLARRSFVLNVNLELPKTIHFCLFFFLGCIINQSF